MATGSPFRTGPLRTQADVEALTMNYVDGYNNHRLHSLLDLATPEEFEQRYYDHHTGSPTGEAANTKTARNPGRLTSTGRCGECGRSPAP